MSDINFWAVLVAAVAAMALGWFWYSKAGFGIAWMKLAGINEEKMKEMSKKSPGLSMLIAFVAVLITSYVLAYFLQMAGANTIREAFLLAFWLWLGFTATVQIGAVLWEGKSTKLFLLNTSYSLIQLLIMAAILFYWG